MKAILSPIYEKVSVAIGRVTESATANWPLLAITRFILAFIVFASHALKEVDSPGILWIGRLGGYEAVLGFLLISGFSIGKSLQKSSQGYFRRRAQRIYPVYLASIALVYVLNPEPITLGFVGVIILNVLFLNQIFTQYSYVGPSWTLALEVWLYALAPWLIRQSYRTLLTLIYGSFFCYVLYTCSRPLLNMPYYAGTMFGANLLVLSFPWVAGFALANYPEKKKAVSFHIFVLLSGHIALTFLIQAAFHIKNGQGAQLPDDIVTYALKGLCVTLTGYVLLSQRGFPTLSDWQKKVFNLLGNISYPLYLTHLSVIPLCERYGITSWYMVTFSALVVATIVYWIFDFYAKNGHNSPPHPIFFMNRIKSLDGLRAISIIMVVLFHASKTLPAQIVKHPAFQYVANSGLGVKIFFVISGYLITKLLIQEQQKTGDINIKDFYIRRALRIFPIFYLYILVIIILKEFFMIDGAVTYSTIFFAGAYLWNYKHLFSSSSPNETFFFGHFWTLAMEEQFYLIWPLTFKYTKREKLIRIAFYIVLAMPFIRVATYFLMPNSRGQIGMMIQTGGDAILVGCLGALLENRADIQEKYFRYLHNKVFMAGVILFLFIISKFLGFWLGNIYLITVGASLANVAVLIFVLWCVYVPTKFADFLNNRFVVHIGVLSYSIYIWHLLFIRNINSLLVDKLPDKPWFTEFPQNLVFVYLCAVISYYLLEKPVLKLKKRFTSQKTKDLTVQIERV